MEPRVCTENFAWRTNEYRGEISADVIENIPQIRNRDHGLRSRNVSRL